MAVDLHTHSNASDGSDPPAKLVRLAAERRLTTIALTDHDNLDGIAEARQAAAEVGIGFVPGVELSLEWAKGGMHMVALWIEDQPGPLQDRLSGLRDSRNSRNSVIVQRLRSLGIDITMGEVEAEAGEGTVGRPHIAAVMVAKGAVPDIQTAFNEFLANGRPAYVDRVRLQPEEALRLVAESGGISILAHPHTTGIDNRVEMADMLERLKAGGLTGIECHYGTYDADGRSGMVALARRFGLIPSGGSDYHGTYKIETELGTGKVGLPVPEAVLEELEASRR